MLVVVLSAVYASIKGVDDEAKIVVVDRLDVNILSGFMVAMLCWIGVVVVVMIVVTGVVVVIVSVVVFVVSIGCNVRSIIAVVRRSVVSRVVV